MAEINTKERIAIVTGSSSGIGLETALTLAENNFITYATMRNLDKSLNILEPAQRKNLSIKVLPLDVTDDISVHRAIQRIVDNESRIDLLVNNAGYTQFGAAEDLSSEEIQAQFNTNVFGVFRTIREVAPIMRRQKEGGSSGGTIINIGSANGFFGVPCAAAYVSTKFALEGLTQSLRYELASFGIKVSIIEPGAIRTNVITQSMYIPKKLEEEQQEQQSNKYSPFAEMTKNIMEKSKTVVANGSSPKVVANMVLKVANTEKPKWRYRAGTDAERLFEARTKMNDVEFEKFLYELFDLWIIYGIIFTADKALGKDVKEKIPFTVFNHNTMAMDDNIKEWGTDISVEGEGVDLRLYLEDSKNTFSPGDNIKGKLIVENSSGRKRIKNAEIILRGIESTYASNSTRISTIETYKQKVEFNGEDSNSASFEIHIPKEVKRSYKAVYSKYYWEIDAKLDIAGSRDLHVSTNIQIVWLKKNAVKYDKIYLD